MLLYLALGLILTLVVLLFSGRASVISALVFTPLVFGLMGGFGLELGPMAMKGIVQVAPPAVLLAFAILFFSLMSDAGLFDPLIRRIVRVAHGDPVRIVTGTAALGLLVSLDGDGSTTYLICCAAMMPLYRRMGLDTRILACLLALSCGITNVFPWGGPTARIAASLQLEIGDLFVPMLPGMAVGALSVMFIGYYLGRAEQKRLGIASHTPRGVIDDEALVADLSLLHKTTARPDRLWINFGLTALVFALLVAGVLPLPLLFMVATVSALLINYPKPASQMERLLAHSPAVFRVVLLVFAAGVLVGIMQETGMNAALARALVEHIPPALGPYLGVVAAILSMPVTFVLENYAYHYAILPSVVAAAQNYGFAPVEIARTVLISQAVHLLCPLVPSTYLLLGLTEISMSAHQRFTLKWAVLLSTIMLTVCILTGAIPFHRG